MTVSEEKKREVYQLEHRKSWPEFTQQAINKVKLSAIANYLVTCVETGIKRPPVHHLWFPKPRLNCREMRKGNAPADRDRPGWLKGKNLVIDLHEIPHEIWDAVKEQRRKARSATAKPTSAIRLVSNPEIVEAINKTKGKGILYQ